MKRDPIPTPGPAALPQHAGKRNSRLIIAAALTTLYVREYKVDELAEHLQELHPDQFLDMPNLVQRLIERDDVELVDGKLGLTDQGENTALKEAERLAPRPSQVRLNEQERRIHALGGTFIDPELLTRGQPRAAASAADLAPPAMRPGSEACLALPSRIGNELHYRDGRITSMEGDEIQPAHVDSDYEYHSTRDGRNPDQRMGWRESITTW